MAVRHYFDWGNPDRSLQRKQDKTPILLGNINIPVRLRTAIPTERPATTTARTPAVNPLSETLDLTKLAAKIAEALPTADLTAIKTTLNNNISEIDPDTNIPYSPNKALTITVEEILSERNSPDKNKAISLGLDRSVDDIVEIIKTAYAS
ncbi:MAG: hypothetical protein HC778_00790 [Chamaesiphon sp. CSU_1_12]|nr:hypothetical protein [Chamaesiphon sp. CSU_1_12]